MNKLFLIPYVNIITKEYLNSTTLRILVAIKCWNKNWKYNYFLGKPTFYAKVQIQEYIWFWKILHVFVVRRIIVLPSSSSIASDVSQSHDTARALDGPNGFVIHGSNFSATFPHSKPTVRMYTYTELNEHNNTKKPFDSKNDVHWFTGHVTLPTNNPVGTWRDVTWHTIFGK